MTTRWARFVRGWIAALVSVFIALCSHTLAGGNSPSAAGIALCMAFAAMICIALAGKSLSLPRLAISVCVSQFLFHGAFSLLGTARPEAQAQAQAQAQAPSMTASMTMQQLHLHAADSGMSMPAWMWVAHCIAAAVTIVALRCGERAFWRLLELARPLMRSLFAWLAPLPALAPRFIPTRSEWIPRQRITRATVSRRGPPALAVR